MSRPVSTDDIPRIAAALRLAGDLLETHGPVVLAVVADWRDNGNRSASLDPSTSGTATSWEACTDALCDECPDPTGDKDARRHQHPRTNDPTGEAAASAATTGSARRAGPSDVYDEFQRILTRTFGDSSRINEIVAGIIPPDTPTDPIAYCTNHLRVGICEIRHRGDECRFCYDFRLLWKKPPPPSILGIKHRYGRVTEKQVREALDTEDRLDTTRKRISKSISTTRQTKPAVAVDLDSRPATSDDDDPAVKLADALGKYIAAEATGGNTRRRERALKRYLTAHAAFCDHYALDAPAKAHSTDESTR